MKRILLLIVFFTFFTIPSVYADVFQDDFHDLSKVDTQKTDAYVDLQDQWVQLPLRPLPNALALNQYVGKGYAVAQADGVSFYAYDSNSGKIEGVSALKINVSNPLAVSLFQDEMAAFVLIPNGDIKYFEMSGAGFVENPALDILGTNQVISISSSDTGEGKKIFTLNQYGQVQGYTYAGNAMVPISSMAVNTGLTDPVAISAVPNNDTAFVVTTKTGAVYYTFDGTQYQPIQLLTGLSGVVSSQVDASGSIVAAVSDKVSVYVNTGAGLSDATNVLGQSPVSNPYSVSLNSDIYQYGVLTGDGQVKYYEPAADGTMAENSSMTMTGLTLTKYYETPRQYVSQPVVTSYPVDVVRLNTQEQNDLGTAISYEISTDGGTTFLPLTLGTWTDVSPGSSLVLRATLSTTVRQNTPRLLNVRLEYGQLTVGELTATKQYLPGPRQTNPLPTTLFPVYERSGGQVEFTVKTTGAAQSVVATYSDGTTQNLVPIDPTDNEQNTWFGWYEVPVTDTTGQTIDVTVVASRGAKSKSLTQAPFIEVDGTVQSKLKIRLIR
ncbi:hypothetical protein [Aneurinibacillus terranovensis]|uniref:hypothetical protein n=1 Tax=Aneurinibacillus terranovensis TaxID=278991 RepID=UPI000401455A|nr:hypothetical protein [Aneurinibacillus terranovensis]